MLRLSFHCCVGLLFYLAKRAGHIDAPDSNMSTSYHIAGWISVFFFVLSLGGVAEQLRLIWRRKRRFHAALASDDATSDLDRPTAVLSLNQFFASFLAFYSFLVYGLCLSPLNHYLVWTRLPATLLVACILFEIWHDRQTRLSACAFGSGAVMIIAAVGLLLAGPRLASEGRVASAGLALFAAAVFAQGIIHQILRVRQTGHTGAVSLRMHQLTTCKDASTILLAVTMPPGTGWPLMTVGAVGIVTKTVLMWHFRWTRLSPVAAERRKT